LDSDDVLAILFQTIDPAAHHTNFSSAAVHASSYAPVHATLYPHESAAVSSAPSAEPRRAELFIVDKIERAEKQIAPVRLPAPFLTEVMDLESIAASARESATAASGEFSDCASGDASCASQVAKQQVVAEMSAVAEEFVAEQRHNIAPDPASSAHERPQDRRLKRRALISAPIRVRTVDALTSGSQEIATTFDVSRSGILFHTQQDCYSRGMQVAVVFPYSKSPKAIHTEQTGRVVRVIELGDGLRGVAITFSAGPVEDLSAAAEAAANDIYAPPPPAETGPAKKPMVLAVESDQQVRDSLKMYLENEGYDVMAVSNAADAREVLDLFVPSLLVAEIEGQGDERPGYDLCGHVKATWRLRKVPVVLTTFSAYPSDYSQAHALGAIVCMAKPYKQERLGHIVRLLAPLPEHIERTAAPYAADPTRVPGRDFSALHRRDDKNSGAKNFFGKLLFRFPAFR
jgi:CheY-like chemotaxis protein